MTYKILSNIKGSRSMEVGEEHLETIEKYALLSDLLDSNGIVDESVLNKLRLNVVALLDNTNGESGLLQFCRDILFHDNMKAFALHQLICLFIEWQEKKVAAENE